MSFTHETIEQGEAARARAASRLESWRRRRSELGAKLIAHLNETGWPAPFDTRQAYISVCGLVAECSLEVFRLDHRRG